MLSAPEWMRNPGRHSLQGLGGGLMGVGQGRECPPAEGSFQMQPERSLCGHTHTVRIALLPCCQELLPLSHTHWANINTPMLCLIRVGHRSTAMATASNVPSFWSPS